MKNAVNAMKKQVRERRLYNFTDEAPQQVLRLMLIKLLEGTEMGIKMSGK